MARSATAGLHAAGARAAGAERATPTNTSLLAVLGVAVAGAWVIAVVAQASGAGILLHHHALIEGGPPLWVAIPVFLLAWQVMIAGMMLPASGVSIDRFAAVAARTLTRPALAVGAFLFAYTVVWTAFGLFAFLGDVVLHRVVDATPWLAARPWLIASGAVGLAGAYQFTALKRRSLAACRHPVAAPAATAAPSGTTATASVRAASSAGRVGLAAGIAHAVDCLGASWALMLLMFAAGVANLSWMVALTAVMAYETLGSHGQRAASLVGVGLISLAAVGLLSGGMPSWTAP